MLITSCICKTLTEKGAGETGLANNSSGSVSLDRVSLVSFLLIWQVNLLLIVDLLQVVYSRDLCRYKYVRFTLGGKKVLLRTVVVSSSFSSLLPFLFSFGLFILLLLFSFFLSSCTGQQVLHFS